MFQITQKYEKFYGGNERSVVVYLVKADDQETALNLVKKEKESDESDSYEYTTQPFSGVSFDDPDVRLLYVWGEFYS